MGKLKISKQDVIDVIKKRWWIILIEFGILAVILLADLLSKKYVVDFLFKQSGHSYVLINGFINLTYTENTGAGFGLFAGNTTALTVITAIVIVGILIYLILAQKENMWLRVSLLFIVGGGIGNLVDRIALGYVRDFIQFAFWKNFAIFNIADSFVTVGVFMLVIVLIVMLVSEGKKNKKEFEAEQAGKPEQELSDPLDAPIALNPMMKSENDYTFEVSEKVSEKETKETSEKERKETSNKTQSIDTQKIDKDNTEQSVNTVGKAAKDDSAEVSENN